MLKLFKVSNPRAGKYFDADLLPWILMLSQCQASFCQDNYPCATQQCPSMIIDTYGPFCLSSSKCCCSKNAKGSERNNI